MVGHCTTTTGHEMASESEDAASVLSGAGAAHSVPSVWAVAVIRSSKEAEEVEEDELDDELDELELEGRRTADPTDTDPWECPMLPRCVKPDGNESDSCESGRTGAWMPSESESLEHESPC